MVSVDFQGLLARLGGRFFGVMGNWGKAPQGRIRDYSHGHFPRIAHICLLTGFNLPSAAEIPGQDKVEYAPCATGHPERASVVS